MQTTNLNRNSYAKIIKQVENISVEKNKLYGSENLIKYGQLGMVIRLDDKMARLSNLVRYNKLKNYNNLKSYSIQDNCLDMINYLIYLIMLNRGELIEHNKKL